MMKDFTVKQSAIWLPINGLVLKKHLSKRIQTHFTASPMR